MSISDWNISIDVVLYLMKAPYSYTSEDMVEVHTFSSLPLLQKLITQFILKGARPAQPGEFTRRAFMAGKIDLTQVEAVQNLIAATNEAERRMAMQGVTGELSRTLQHVNELLTKTSALLEAYIDFVEESPIPAHREEIVKNLREALQAMQAFSQKPSDRYCGVNVCLYGMPNAGKSSLFNRLLGRQAAITSDVPGTTLDWLEGEIEISGNIFRLIDTPGIMKISSVLHLRSQEKLKILLQGADIILYLIDSSKPLSDFYISLWKQLPGVPILLLKSKSDIASSWNIEDVSKILGDVEVMEVSIYDENTIESILNWLVEKGSRRVQEPVFLNLRQYYIAQETSHLISQILEDFDHDISYEFLAVDLRAALNLIGELFGRTTTEDILDRIFANFCVGK